MRERAVKDERNGEIVLHYAGRNAAAQAKVNLEGVSFWAGEQVLISLTGTEWEELAALHRDLVHRLHPLQMSEVTQMLNLMQQHGWLSGVTGQASLVSVLTIGKLAANGGYVIRASALNGTWDIASWAEFQAFQTDVWTHLGDRERRPV